MRFIIFFIIAMSCWCNYALAKSGQDIDYIAQQILEKELELQKLNTYLHIFTANPSFWRSRRTWLWDTGNALCTEGGLIAATSLLYSHSNSKLRQTIEIRFDKGKPTIEHKVRRVANRIPTE